MTMSAAAPSQLSIFGLLHPRALLQYAASRAALRPGSASATIPPLTVAITKKKTAKYFVRKQRNGVWQVGIVDYFFPSPWILLQSRPFRPCVQPMAFAAY